MTANHLPRTSVGPGATAPHDPVNLTGPGISCDGRFGSYVQLGQKSALGGRSESTRSRRLLGEGSRLAAERTRGGLEYLVARFPDEPNCCCVGERSGRSICALEASMSSPGKLHGKWRLGKRTAVVAGASLAWLLMSVGGCGSSGSSPSGPDSAGAADANAGAGSAEGTAGSTAGVSFEEYSPQGNMATTLSTRPTAFPKAARASCTSRTRGARVRLRSLSATKATLRRSSFPSRLVPSTCSERRSR